MPMGQGVRSPRWLCRARRPCRAAARAAIGYRMAIVYRLARPQLAARTSHLAPRARQQPFM